MDEGGEILEPVNTNVEEIPEEVKPENYTEIQSLDSETYSDEDKEEIVRQMQALQQEIPQATEQEQIPMKKEKAFKIGKMLGLGTLFALLLTLWTSIKSMFGKGQSQYGQ